MSQQAAKRALLHPGLPADSVFRQAAQVMLSHIAKKLQKSARPVHSKSDAGAPKANAYTPVLLHIPNKALEEVQHCAPAPPAPKTPPPQLLMTAPVL